MMLNKRIITHFIKNISSEWNLVYKKCKQMCLHILMSIILRWLYKIWWSIFIWLRFWIWKILSHSYDVVHLFDFAFVLNEDISLLLETFEVNWSYSTIAVLSFRGWRSVFWIIGNCRRRLITFLCRSKFIWFWFLSWRSDFWIIGNYRRRLITF